MYVCLYVTHCITQTLQDRWDKTNTILIATPTVKVENNFQILIRNSFQKIFHSFVKLCTKLADIMLSSSIGSFAAFYIFCPFQDGVCLYYVIYTSRRSFIFNVYILTTVEPKSVEFGRLLWMSTHYSTCLSCYSSFPTPLFLEWGPGRSAVRLIKNKFFWNLRRF